uniref:RING-type domain-containing protein n=1 Tax=Zea mays TaxID=4577 RepID=A0A804QVS6_MAIZE
MRQTKRAVPRAEGPGPGPLGRCESEPELLSAPHVLGRSRGGAAASLQPVQPLPPPARCDLLGGPRSEERLPRPGRADSSRGRWSGPLPSHPSTIDSLRNLSPSACTGARFCLGAINARDPRHPPHRPPWPPAILGCTVPRLVPPASTAPTTPVRLDAAPAPSEEAIHVVMNGTSRLELVLINEGKYPDVVLGTDGQGNDGVALVDDLLQQLDSKETWVSCIKICYVLFSHVYADGDSSMSTYERRASLREFYAIIYPILQQLESSLIERDLKGKGRCKDIVSRRRMEDWKKVSGRDVEREDECGICMEACTKMVLPNCSHAMCIKCHRDWYKRSESCPFCRGSLKRICSTDLWVLTNSNDVIDPAHLEKENVCVIKASAS